MRVAISVVPLKNSTWLIVPSVSCALAAIVMSAGAVKVALCAGLVRLTAGRELKRVALVRPGHLIREKTGMVSLCFKGR